MTIAITDANIFIDLILLDLLSSFFELDITIYTAEEILLELEDDQVELLEKFAQKDLLTIYTLEQEQLERLGNIEFNKGLSVPDRRVIFLAMELEGIVLTGDKLVRKFCKKHELVVHGILWIFDQLLEEEIIKKTIALTKLEQLLLINPRLPKEACKERLIKWKGNFE